MELFVYSRPAIERVPAHDVPHVVISITSSLHDQATIPTNAHTLEVVRLAFLDVSGGAPGAMTAADTDAVASVVLRHAKRARRMIAALNEKALR